MKAFLKNYAQTPRKTRLVANLIKGKTVPEALLALKFLEKRAAVPVSKLIQSAAANAEKQGETSQTLIVKSLTVNKGLVRSTVFPRAQGRPNFKKHRMSHLQVTLARGK